MTATTTRHRRLSSWVVLLLALGLVGGVYTAFASAFAPSGQAAESVDPARQVQAGSEIYLKGCSTCHGIEAQGTNIAPSLIGVGGAAAYFQVSTGRMPLAEHGPQADRKQRLYDDKSTRELAAYIQSLGGGPDIPKVDTASADLTLGGELFRTNCASCHNFVGSGGALTYGKYAPEVEPASETQIAAAMLSGPESMPIFGNTTFDKSERDSIVKYIRYVSESDNPGGNGLGRLGPVSEGMVLWLLGIGGLLVATLWIGNRA